ncbi:hypothetical protein LASAK_01007 [Latilactobacillus sakei]|nr:hypothetical protein LASAK_01007 [Latilactobacillus sakei]
MNLLWKTFDYKYIIAKYILKIKCLIERLAILYVSVMVNYISN